MASYASVAEFREYMDQVASGAATDARIQRILDRASAIIDIETRTTFGAAAVGTQVVYGDGTIYLEPPVFVAGSVTAITAPSGYTIPDYIERDGLILIVDSSGMLSDPLWQVWERGVPYTVAATFGYASIPPVVAECCLQIAVRLWRGKDAGFSDVVGVDGGGAVGYNGAYSALVKRLLVQLRPSVGAW